MKMKVIHLFFCFLFVAVASAQAIDLDKQNRDPKYVESIVGRSQKIVDKLGIADKTVQQEVCNIIAVVHSRRDLVKTFVEIED